MPKKLDPKVAEAVMLKAGLKPLTRYYLSNAKWKSKCLNCSVIVFPRYDKIKQGQKGCRDCGIKRAQSARRFSDSDAKKIMLQNQLKPLEPYKGADLPWKCKCLVCGGESSPRLASVKKGRRCRHCGHNKTADRNRLSQNKTEKLMLKSKIKPLEPYMSANTPWKCKCLNCKKIINPTYANIQQGSGCEYCARTKVDAKDAVKVMIKAKLKPLEPYKDSKSRWKCLHMTCGEIVFPRYSDVRKGLGGCNVCAKKNAISHRKIPEKKAIRLMLKNGMKPLEPFVDTNTKWKCRCLKCKKVIRPRYSAVNRGSTCTYCSGNKVDPKDAVRMMLRAKIKPLEPYKRADSPWKSQCLKCCRIIKPQYSSVYSGQGGCRYCSKKGINMNTPSYLYLITHFELNAHKVGMGNHKRLNDRLGRFKREGWVTYRVWQTETGSEAIDIESEVLRILRTERNLPAYLSKAEMPKTEGHTETVDADSITLLELEKIIKKAIKGYRR
jgi:hypothetical protein